jgi:hypothetical protein
MRGRETDHLRERATVREMMQIERETETERPKMQKKKKKKKGVPARCEFRGKF